MKKLVATASQSRRPLVGYQAIEPGEATIAVAHQIGREATTQVEQQPGDITIGSEFTVSLVTKVPREELAVALTRAYGDEAAPDTLIIFVSTDGDQHTFMRVS